MCIAKKGLDLVTTAHKRVAFAYNLNPVKLCKGRTAGALADRKCVVLVPRQHRVKLTDSGTI